MQKRVKKILGILLVISLLVGMSYAIWYMTLKQPISNVVASKCFSISIINEKNEINLEEAYPITDEDGKNLTPYSFTIKNTCSTFLSYKVKIEILKESDLSEEYLDVLLNHEEISKLSNLESVEVSDNDKYKKAYEIASGSLGEEDEEDYTLRIWMDYDTPPISEVMNKIFKSKVTIEASMSNYSPVENGINTLHDAILTNEYQVTDINTAINKIKNKQTPDFSKTAPVITWQEQVEEKETTVSFTMPDPSDIGSGKDYASNLTDKNVYPAFATEYSFDEDNGIYTLKLLDYQDPATIDFSSQEYYVCDAYIYKDALNNKIGARSRNECSEVKQIKKLENVEATTWSEYSAVKYNFTVGKILSEVELESDKSDKGLYIAEDDYGESYYYRGAVKNNYVKFANFCWRIVRINGDDSIRLLYAGKSCDATGHDAVIEASAYNLTANRPLYVGYMYGDYTSDVLNKVNANINPSTIKSKVDNWYVNNLLSYQKFVFDGGFCNDRSLFRGDGISKVNVTTYYGAYRVDYSNPSLKCTNIQDDLYTTTSNDVGNNSLDYPVGLISVDEVLMAGNKRMYKNPKNYTFINYAYWTMTPNYFSPSDNATFVYYVTSDNDVLDGWLRSDYGVRPVINLKSTVKISDGNGTMANPFVVETD